jgi:hypothetical protein
VRSDNRGTPVCSQTGPAGGIACRPDSQIPGAPVCSQTGAAGGIKWRPDCRVSVVHFHTPSSAFHPVPHRSFRPMLDMPMSSHPAGHCLPARLALQSNVEPNEARGRTAGDASLRRGMMHFARPTSSPCLHSTSLGLKSNGIWAHVVMFRWATSKPGQARGEITNDEGANDEGMTNS